MQEQEMGSSKWKSEEPSLLKHRLEKYYCTTLMKFLFNTQLFHLMGKQTNMSLKEQPQTTEYSSTALELMNMHPFLPYFVKNQKIGRKP